MANEPQPGASPLAPPPPKPSEMDQREDWFITTPNPWTELVQLEYGADRTYATTIERMVLNAEPAQRPALEQKLITALAQPALRPAGRQFICRMLGLIGSAASVAALTPLLRADAMADAARLALDGISDNSEVDSAYRAALVHLSGPAKAGLIGSIALRGDKSALPELRSIAADEHQAKEVRTAALRAVDRLSAAS